MLIDADERRRHATVLWSIQVDAAAGVEAVHEVDSGGARARVVLRGRRRRRGGKGEMNRTLAPIYKAVDRWHARESRRPKNGYVAAWMPRFSGGPLKMKIY